MPEVIWSDLHPDLKIGNDGQVKIVKDIEAVYASLENILLVSVNQRCMMRSFGSNLLALLYEPLEDDQIRARVTTELRDIIEMWEPRVKMNYLDVRSNPERQTLYIKMEFYVRSYDQLFTFAKTYKP